METNIIHVRARSLIAPPPRPGNAINYPGRYLLLTMPVLRKDSTGHYITYTPHLEEESYIDRGFHKRTLAPLPRPPSGLKT
ncbi:hypothetical protein TWF225_004098 [Orbilia oligospora]|nr:hypothetical protein TWF225_004098 [Orbilia oligospora]